MGTNMRPQLDAGEKLHRSSRPNWPDRRRGRRPCAGRGRKGAGRADCCACLCRQRSRLSPNSSATWSRRPWNERSKRSQRFMFPHIIMCHTAVSDAYQAYFNCCFRSPAGVSKSRTTRCWWCDRDRCAGGASRSTIPSLSSPAARSARWFSKGHSRPAELRSDDLDGEWVVPAPGSTIAVGEAANLMILHRAPTSAGTPGAPSDIGLAW